MNDFCSYAFLVYISISSSTNKRYKAAIFDIVSIQLNIV